MQQRYQFILKGTGPLLKEWDIVLSIYDNEKLIVKLKEQQNRLDNSSLDNEIESLPKPKDSEILENQLVEYRAQLQSQPTQDFINKPPLDEEGNPMNYDSDIAKGNQWELMSQSPSGTPWGTPLGFLKEVNANPLRK